MLLLRGIGVMLALLALATTLPSVAGQQQPADTGLNPMHVRHHFRPRHTTTTDDGGATSTAADAAMSSSMVLPHRPTHAKPWEVQPVPDPGAAATTQAADTTRLTRDDGDDQQEATVKVTADGATASPLGADPSPSPTTSDGSAAPAGDEQQEEAPANGTSTIAQIIDRALDKEFEVETKSDSAAEGKNFNQTVAEKPAALETVVRISGSGKPAKKDPEDSTAGAGDGGGAAAAALPGDSGGSSGGGGGSGSGGDAVGGDGGGGAAGSGAGGDSGAAGGGAAAEAEEASVEVGVDRIIDSHDNEFVLSAPTPGSVASLTLDPQLVQDLTFTLASAAVVGSLFEAIKQPVINGYLIAGAIVGPGGLQLIKELVQVESLAQLGVQLLLFGLGRELSMSKLRPVLRVALLGGSLQIAALMLIGGAVGGVIGGSVQQGLFVGALLSMSSTSVVIKCLETTRCTMTAYGQLTIGTLVLQDCTVGLMFALMPAFASKGGKHSATAAAMTRLAASSAAGGDGAGAGGGGGGDQALAAAAAAAAADSEAFARLAVVMLVLRVLMKLALMLLAAWVVARFVLPPVIQVLVRHASRELVQLALVSICLTTAWLCGQAELSEELGAFLAGAVVAAAERSLVIKGALLPSGHLTSPMSSDASPRGAAAAAALALAAAGGPPGSGGAGGGNSGGGGGGGAGGAAAPACAEIESLSNVLTALFVASIGLIMSPVFLWHHATVLLAGTAVVMAVKAVVVAGVVRLFGVPARTAWAAGLTMAHTGEFSFVLLSMAHQLRLLPETLYMLLLGITATSLLTTPMVILATHALLHGPSGQQYQPVSPGTGGKSRLAVSGKADFRGSDGDASRVLEVRGSA